jgi:predicted porin
MFMKRISSTHYSTAACVTALLLGGLAAPAGAIDLKNADGTWTFSVNGNVNVHYIYSSCESASSQSNVGGGLACVGSANSKSTSSVGNGLLPAAITFAVATTQAGIDLATHFGLYPGIVTNDGGSPNLQQTNGNFGLGTTGLDVRQVFMTFGNKTMGTFTLGRNFGLFGFDAIINDMTIPGVGVAGSMSGPNPANTSLGSIGLGYIYTDTYAQMNYTTPDYSGLNFTIGIFNPLNSLSEPGPALNKGAPGVHGKVAYSTSLSDANKLYLSATFLTQKNAYDPAGPVTSASYTSTGWDATAKFDVGGLSLLGSYYRGSGMGTTALFLRDVDAAGNKRDSDGYLAQATYKVGDVKFGVNYGVSNLDLASGEIAPTLVKSNSKVTGGVYYSLTKNLTVLGEISSVEAKAHDGNKNKSDNFNIGVFLSF